MKKVILAFLCCLAISACVPATPQARVARNPDMFATLDSKTQALVLAGQVAQGMPPAAVALAWGSPARSFEGSKNSKITQRWDYASTIPVYTPGPYYYGAYGYRPYGRYGPYGYPGYGFGLGPEINYIPYRSASVWFIDGRVDAWERVR